MKQLKQQPSDQQHKKKTKAENVGLIKLRKWKEM